MDVVYHAAAIYKAWMPDPTRMYEVNIRGTFHMLEAARAANVGKVIYTASIVSLGRPNNGATGNWTWPSAIFPYIDHAPLYNQLQPGFTDMNPAAANGPIGPTFAQNPLVRTPIDVYMCPSDPGDEGHLNRFLGNYAKLNYPAAKSIVMWRPFIQDGGHRNRVVRIRDITDGTSSTAFVSDSGVSSKRQR